MKALILCLFALSLFLVNTQYVVHATNLLTPKVASDGFLILDTKGLTFPLRMKNLPRQDQFKLTVTNTASNANTKLSCFLYQFENSYYSSAKIGCRTRGLTPGKYTLAPLTNTLTFTPVRNPVVLQTFNIPDTFEVTKGKELYFYEYDDNDEDFDRPSDVEDIDFDLFEPASGNHQIYFENVEVNCSAIRYELKCRLTPNMFSRSKSSYNVFIKDSLGNKKRNYFVLPVTIIYKY